MAAAGKSLTPFYVIFGAVAIGGGLLIYRSSQSGGPPLTIETTAPITAGPRGVQIGPDSAPIEILEFSDFECPYCARFAAIQMPDVQQRLMPTGKVKWRFIHYPLNIHHKGPYAHLAAACANEQGRFWPMHDAIYQYQEAWVASRNPQNELERYARQIGLDMPRYQSCMQERRAWGQVLNDKRLGDSIGIGGTPTFFVNGRQLPGTPSVDELLRIADSLSAPAAPRARAGTGR